jgi:hypothetical protein
LGIGFAPVGRVDEDNKVKKIQGFMPGQRA